LEAQKSPKSFHEENIKKIYAVGKIMVESFSLQYALNAFFVFF